MKLEGLIGGPTGTTAKTAIEGVANKVDQWVIYFHLFIIGMVALLFVAYAVWIGIKMAKAEDEGGRTEAKKKIIYAIIGLLVIAGLEVIIQAVNLGTVISTTGYTQLTGAADAIIITKAIVNAFLLIVMSLASLFCCWVGWKFVSADDDSKRTEAKKQLIYTVFACVAVIGINTIAQIVFKAVGDGVLPQGTGQKIQ